MNKATLATVIITSLLLAACASSSKTDMPENGTSNRSGNTADTVHSTSADTSNNSQQAGAVSAASGEQKQSTNQADSHNTKSIYFDFDKSFVKPEYRGALEEEVSFIKNNSGIVVILEGNADERGSAAYNLALGNRRASAVRKNLVLMGIPSSRIKVISYGAEKPKRTCHEEECWRENRRVDLLVRVENYPENIASAR